jgi:hypothetical protein
LLCQRCLQVRSRWPGVISALLLFELGGGSMIRFGYDAVGFVVGDVAISARGAVLHLAVTAAHENGVVRFVGDGEPFLRRQLPQNLFRFVDFYDTATNQAEGVDPAKRDGRGAQVLADVVPELGFLPLVKRVNHQLQLVLTTLRQRSRALECRRLPEREYQ